MTRPYAMCRLLEHGPLRFAEMLEITRWPKPHLEIVLDRLEKRGRIRRFHQQGCHRNVYRLAA
jgi:DNA-binding MarR family transcriptional regulator